MPLKIFLRGEIWHYRGTVAGRRLRGSTGITKPNKETALRIAAEKEAREWKRHLDGPASVLTFAQASILYRAAGKSTRFLPKVEDYWKNTIVKQITAGAIRQSAIDLYPNASAATRNRQVIVPTQAVINHAAEAELCPYIRVQRFSVTKREKRPATWGWIASFMSASPPHLGALACFMYLTGARISEALSVKWDDLSLKSSSCLIRQTKTNSERIAHLPPKLVVALANIPGEREGRVFKYRASRYVWPTWKRVVARAGIAPLLPHACRHGFATGLLDKGVSPKTVAKRGGWKSTQHVFETYGHDIADEQITNLLIDTPETQRKSVRSKAKGRTSA